MAGNDAKQTTVVIAVDASSKAEEAVQCKYILLHVLQTILCALLANRQDSQIDLKTKLKSHFVRFISPFSGPSLKV